MKLHFTSGYHLEGDGQTERTNQTLEQYIRVYCNYQQDNWYQLLPLSEFAYNNAPSATTKVTPFYANKGYHPNLTIHPEQDLASLWTREFVTDLDELHKLVLGKFGLVRSGAIFARPGTRQSGPRRNFWDWDRDCQGLSISVWSQSRHGPDGPWW